MRLTSKLKNSVFTLAIVLAVGPAPVLAQPFTMKIAHVVPQGDPRDVAARHVAELMGASSSCEMGAEVFPSAQLGSTTDLIEGMQIGSIEAVVLPASFIVGFEPMMGLFDFPYFWPSELEDLVTLHNSEAMRALLDTTADQDVYSMGVWHTGYKQWTANTALDEPEDYAGLSARVMPSEVLVEQQSALGMTPVDMPFPETYSALQSGAIDAQENPVPTSFFMRFHEVQTHITMTNHGNLDQIFMVSQVWWDSLTPDCQTELTAAVASGQDVVIAETQRVEELAMAAFAEQGLEVITPTAEQLEVLRERTLPASRSLFISRTGDEGEAMIEQIEAAIAGL